MAHEKLTALAVLNGLPAAAAVVSAEGMVLLANRSWHAMPAALAVALRTALQAQASDTLPKTPIEWQVQGEAPRFLRLHVQRLEGAPEASGEALVQVEDVTSERQTQDALLRIQEEMRELEERLRCFSEVTSETMVINERGRILFVNAAVNRMFGRTPEEAIGHSVLEFVAPESKDEVVHQLSIGQSGDPYEFTGLRKDGTRFHGEALGRQILYHGRPVRAAAIRDITRRKQAEDLARQRLLAEERIRAETAALSALETPLIPISESVTVMPLIGSLDVGRMTRATEALLSGIQGGRVRWAILDITGVPSLESATAAALVRAAKGARLLGSQVMLSGVRSEVAQALVRMGLELAGVVTLPTLQEAIRHALQRSGGR